jgi:hypothetical protein
MPLVAFSAAVSADTVPAVLFEVRSSATTASDRMDLAVMPLKNHASTMQRHKKTTPKEIP